MFLLVLRETFIHLENKLLQKYSNKSQGQLMHIFLGKCKKYLNLYPLIFDNSFHQHWRGPKYVMNMKISEKQDRHKIKSKS